TANCALGTQVLIEEIDAVGGSPVPGGESASIVLNPDPSNPQLSNPQLSNSELHNPQLSNPQLSNPQLSNPQLSNPQLSNPQLSNPHLSNPQLSNPQLSNPQLSNPKLSNPPIGNSPLAEPTQVYANISALTWTVQNAGNTSSGYQSIINVANEQALLQTGHRTAIIVYRTYSVPALN